MHLKRIFDLAVCLASAIFWLPIFLLTCVVAVIFHGFPVFYISRRRVSDRCIHLIKFRAMVLDADKVANRLTIPVASQRFLNLPPDCPLYTRFGRLLERFQLVEIPQLFHVLSGQMTLVGNRPLPESVIASLREEHPDVNKRFLVKAGMTGPVQLVGRNDLSDRERLDLEILYCRLCRRAYSPRLDFLVLFYTVVVALRFRRAFTLGEVRRLVKDHAPEALFSSTPSGRLASTQSNRIITPSGP